MYRNFSKLRLLAGIFLVLSFALPLFLFQYRTVVAPLHWAGVWVCLIGIYISAVIGLTKEKRYKFIAIFFPILVISFIEAGWHVKDYIGQKILGTSLAGDMMARSPALRSTAGKIRQADIDSVYRKLVMDLHFMPDAIRLIVWPPNFKSKIVNTNSLGFRDSEFKKKSSGVYRVVVFGDSGLFGWSAPNDRSIITHYLEQYLTSYLSNKKKVEVLNLGVGSANSAIHYPTFATYGQSLAPDLVIFFLGLNDLGGGNLAASSFNKRMRKHFLNHTFFRKIKYLFMQLAEGFHVLALNSKIYSSIVSDEKFVLVEPGRKSAFNEEVFKKTYLSNMEKIYRLAARLKIKVVTFEQPSSILALRLADPKTLTKFEKLIMKKTKANYPWLWTYTSPEYYDGVVSDGDDIANKYGFSHYGFRKMLENHKGSIYQGPYVGEPNGSIFISTAHYTAHGNNLIAENIFKRVKQLISVKSE